ncbi:MAG: diguanylate cyclase [Hyphomicrobium sp.]|uniref:GGDEF domain-containing protein n=1 Tax=Hyphomicrobium sp. TaxID=82 RepID=UPI003D13AD7B
MSDPERMAIENPQLAVAESTRWNVPALTALKTAALVLAVVLAACLVGIVTRPAGLLAAVWPANAILLGFLVRNPRLSSPAGWLAAIAAYLAADLATGASFYKTLLLTAGNMVGVAVAFALFMRFSELDRRLRRPFSVLYLGLITAAGATAAGMVGAVINPILFHGSALVGWSFWFVTEFVNYVAFLPVVLTLPAPGKSILDEWHFDRESVLRTASPFAALVAACLASVWIGGPGAVAFPVPALIWCALAYTLSGTAIVTLVFSAWTLVAISAGAIHVGADFNSGPSLLSIRIGVALMALAPITIASIIAARNEFQALLQRMVTNDPLTAALSRRAFSIRARTQLAEASASPAPVALLLFDIDGMKSINSTYGHTAGDEVLKAFVRTARARLPETDNLGRLGSDEFAVLLPSYGRQDAEGVAHRICAALRETHVPISADKSLRPTVSIGIALAHRAPASAEPLLTQADTALTRARSTGGDRHELVDDA